VTVTGTSERPSIHRQLRPGEGWVVSLQVLTTVGIKMTAF
jgi:hypothetical protein